MSPFQREIVLYHGSPIMFISSPQEIVIRMVLGSPAPKRRPYFRSSVFSSPAFGPPGVDPEVLAELPLEMQGELRAAWRREAPVETRRVGSPGTITRYFIPNKQ